MVQGIAGSVFLPRACEPPFPTVLWFEPYIRSKSASPSCLRWPSAAGQNVTLPRLAPAGRAKRKARRVKQRASREGIGGFIASPSMRVLPQSQESCRRPVDAAVGPPDSGRRSPCASLEGKNRQPHVAVGRLPLRFRQFGVRFELGGPDLVGSRPAIWGWIDKIFRLEQIPFEGTKRGYHMKKTYQKPVLIKRQRLPTITAQLIPVSPTNNQA